MKRNRKQLENIHQEMRIVVAEYFNSIERSFEVTLKYFGKLHPFARYILLPLTVLYMLCILPVIPFVISSLLPSVFPEKVNLFSWSFSVNTFILWWVILGAATYVLFKLANKANVKLINARKLRTLPSAEMPFCFVYAAAKETKAYQLNRHAPHLERAKKLLQLYIDHSEINLTQAQIRDALHTKPEFPLPKLVSTDLVSLLKSSHDWFQVCDSSASILDGFSRLSRDVLDRLSTAIELDRVLALIEPLSFYEFSRVKRESTTTLTSSSVSIPQLGDEFLLQFAAEASTLSPLVQQRTERPDKAIESASRSLRLKLSGVLAHENPLTCFIGWYLLLLLVFSAPLLVVAVLLMPIDSTILIGVLSAPFAGAIAMTTAVYTKKQGRGQSDNLS